MMRAWLAAPLLTMVLAGPALAGSGLSGQEPAAQPGHPPSTREERAVVQELMKIRMFPREYAKYLRSLGNRFQGTLWRLRDHVPIRTNEGRSAVDEAAEFLERVAPVLDRVEYREGLHRAALEHVRDQGPTGGTGHVGSDGSHPRARILRYGGPATQTSEVIMYGQETPRMTVIQLVIDDGVADRSHRKAIFNPELRTAGAATGWHREYGTMTVVDLADSFQDQR